MKPNGKRLTSCTLLAGSLLCLALASCNSNESQPLQSDDKETATVTLRIGTGTSQPNISTRYVDASQYEGIRTLRIIATTGTGTDREIVYNEKVLTGRNNTQQEAVTIPDIPVGQVTFYAIANEESLGMTYDNNQIEEDIVSTDNGSRKVLYIDEAAHFPKLGPDIVDYGLPMSNRPQTVNIYKDMTTPIDISLDRSVVKLLLTVENATRSDIKLNAVTFGPFSGDRLYLFRENLLDVPANAQYKSFGYEGLSINIPSGGSTKKLAAYIYPTYAYTAGMTSSPYTLALKTENRNYEALVFAPNTNSFVRNTQVNITARITTTIGVTIDYKVSDWDPYTINVPDFE